MRKLQPGQTIPLDRTSPALDVDALIGGFRPLFRALDPDQVNALSGELLKVFQGQGGTISSVLAQTSALTTTLAGRDQLIGEVITNLNTVLGTFAARDDQFSEGLDKLSQLAQGLADRKTDIATGTAYINAAAGSVADLLTVARQPIKETVTQTDRFAGQIMADHDYVDDLLKTLPDAYQVLARQGLYGDYFGFYLCDAILKLNGKGGQPVFVKLVGQDYGTVRSQMTRFKLKRPEIKPLAERNRLAVGVVGILVVVARGRRRLLLRQDSVHQGHHRLLRLLRRGRRHQARQRRAGVGDVGRQGLRRPSGGHEGVGGLHRPRRRRTR